MHLYRDSKKNRLGRSCETKAECLSEDSSAPAPSRSVDCPCSRIGVMYSRFCSSQITFLLLSGPMNKFRKSPEFCSARETFSRMKQCISPSGAEGLFVRSVYVREVISGVCRGDPLICHSQHYRGSVSLTKWLLCGARQGVNKSFLLTSIR